MENSIWESEKEGGHIVQKAWKNKASRGSVFVSRFAMLSSRLANAVDSNALSREFVFVRPGVHQMEDGRMPERYEGRQTLSADQQ